MKKAGVMGWPVAHSLSPRLHGYWLKKYGIAGSYEPLAVPPGDLEKALKSLAQQGFSGVNLTVPHKEVALKIVDRLDPAARHIGAVNTIVVNADGTLEGRNTDAYGFAQNLHASRFKGTSHPAVVLGAGGAARAVIVALLDMGLSEIRVINRSRERAEKLVRELSGDAGKLTSHIWADLDHALKNAGLIVNATSLGMKGQPPLDIALDALSRDAVVADIVYAPLLTSLLQKARARGHATVDGLGMLLHQARPTFKAFFGYDPEVTEELRQFVIAGL